MTLADTANLHTFVDAMRFIEHNPGFLATKALEQLEEELEQMQELPAIRLPEYEELTAWVTREALVRVGRQASSVPARYIGQQVRVRVEEGWLSFYCGQHCIERTPRQPGTGPGV